MRGTDQDENATADLMIDFYSFQVEFRSKYVRMYPTTPNELMYCTDPGLDLYEK